MVLINVFTKLKSINTLLTTALKHLLQTSIAPEIKPAWSVDMEERRLLFFGSYFQFEFGGMSQNTSCFCVFVSNFWLQHSTHQPISNVGWSRKAGTKRSNFGPFDGHYSLSGAAQQKEGKVDTKFFFSLLPVWPGVPVGVSWAAGGVGRKKCEHC